MPGLASTHRPMVAASSGNRLVDTAAAFDALLMPENALRRAGSAAMTAVAVAIASSVGQASADAAVGDTICRHPAPIYRNVPEIGVRLGDVSETPLSYCQPIDDTVRLRSERARFDNLGEAWLPVVVTGRHTGRRVGWIVRRHINVLVEPGHDAAYIPVRPANG